MIAQGFVCEEMGRLLVLGKEKAWSRVILQGIGEVYQNIQQ